MPQSQGTATLPAPSGRGTSFHPVPLHSAQFSRAMILNLLAEAVLHPGSCLFFQPRLLAGRCFHGFPEAVRWFPLTKGYGRNSYSASRLHWENCGRLSLFLVQQQVASSLRAYFIRTIACRGVLSRICDAAMRDNSCCTTCAN